MQKKKNKREKWSSRELNYICLFYLDNYYGMAKITRFREKYQKLINEFQNKYNQVWSKNQSKTHSYLGEFSYFDPNFNRKWIKKSPSSKITKIWDNNFKKWDENVKYFKNSDNFNYGKDKILVKCNNCSEYGAYYEKNTFICKNCRIISSFDRNFNKGKIICSPNDSIENQFIKDINDDEQKQINIVCGLLKIKKVFDKIKAINKEQKTGKDISGIIRETGNKIYFEVTSVMNKEVNLLDRVKIMKHRILQKVKKYGKLNKKFNLILFEALDKIKLKWIKSGIMSGEYTSNLEPPNDINSIREEIRKLLDAERITIFNYIFLVTNFDGKKYDDFKIYKIK